MLSPNEKDHLHASGQAGLDGRAHGRLEDHITAQTVNAPRLRPILTTSAYYLCFTCLGMVAAVGGPTLPYLARLTGSRLDQVSAIFVSVSFGYLLGSLLSGRMYDRIPGSRMLAGALLVMAATMFLVPFLPSLWLLATVMFVLGLAEAVLDVGCNTLLMWVHGAKVGPFMNGLHFFYGVGALLAPIVVAQVLSAGGEIRLAYWLFATLLLPVAAWLWRLPSPPLRAVPEEHAVRRATRLPVVLFVLFFAAYVGAEVSYGNWVYTYSTHLQLASETGAAYLTSTFWGTFTLGRLLGVVLSTRLKPRPILSIDLAGCLIALGILLLWPASTAALWAGTIGLGIFMASIFPTTMAMASQKLALTGTITGWFLVGAGVGGMLVPWLVGQLFVRQGPQVMVTILFVDVCFNVLVLFMLLALPGRKNAPAS